MSHFALKMHIIYQMSFFLQYFTKNLFNVFVKTDIHYQDEIAHLLFLQKEAVRSEFINIILTFLIFKDFLIYFDTFFNVHFL